VQPHTGDRLSLVVYAHPGLPKVVSAGGPLLDSLLSSGFRPSVLDLPSVCAPTRVQVSPANVGLPGHVYIGRGHKGLRLGRSIWANPYPMTRELSRKKAIKRFKLHLASSPTLLAQLEGLGGKALACHCPPELPCHGDVIIYFYWDSFLVFAPGRPPTLSEIDRAKGIREKELSDVIPRPLSPPPLVPTVASGVGDPVFVLKRFFEASSRRRCWSLLSGFMAPLATAQDFKYRARDPRGP